MKTSFAQAGWPVAGTTSAGVNVSGMTVCGLITPSGLTSTSITFQMADKEDGTYVPVKDSSGSAISFTVSTSGYYGFKQDQLAAFYGVPYLKVVGGSSEAAGTIVKLAVREFA